MRILLLLLFCSLQVFAQTDSGEPADKEEKITICIQEYIKKQSKSYSKSAQTDLYDLMNNFDAIMARVYGKKVIPDNLPYTEKLKLLARVQCEAYYEIGALK